MFTIHQNSTKNIIYLDVSICNTDLHQKKLVLSASEMTDNSYQPSYAYNRFLDVTVNRRVKSQKD